MVESIAELRKMCQKTEIPTSEIIQRKFSIYITKLFLYSNITANQITVLSIFLGVISSFILAFGYKWHRVVGVFLLFFWCILDCVDGEVARYKGISSVTGQYLDRLNGMIIEPLLFTLLSFGIFNTIGDPRVFIFGFLSALSVLQVRLVVANMYTTALVTRLSMANNYQTVKNGVLNDDIVGVSDLQNSIKNKSSIIYDVIDSMIGCPGTIIALFIVVMLDNFIPPFLLGDMSLNFIYVFLILYGISAFIGSAFLLLLVFKNKSVEKLYQRILRL